MQQAGKKSSKVSSMADAVQPRQAESLIDVEFSPFSVRVSQGTECVDALTMKLQQIEAISTMASGCAGNTVDDETKATALWACGTLATECRALAGAVWQQVIACREANHANG